MNYLAWLFVVAICSLLFNSYTAPIEAQKKRAEYSNIKSIQVNYDSFLNQTTFTFFDTGEVGVIEIFDLVGQRVRLIEFRSGSIRPVIWDGKSDKGVVVSQGAYIYRFTQGKRALSGKIIHKR
ncbi:MAG: hypothetical protein ACRC6R_01395 [Bacteroidales bacterium]